MQSNGEAGRGAEGLAVYAIGKVIGAVFDARVALAGTIGLSGTLWILALRIPAQQLTTTSLFKGAELIVSASLSAFWTVLGWVMAAIILVGCMYRGKTQQSRIERQGAQVAELRAAADPHRMSSRDRKNLAEYENKARQRFEVRDEPD